MRHVLVLALFAAGLFLAFPVVAAEKEPILKQDGFTLPWFHSAAERRAREACEREDEMRRRGQEVSTPECRAEVRREMAAEKAASMVTPWLVLGGGILIALFYFRAQERKRAKKRARAQRRHDPRTSRKLNRMPDERAGRDEDDEAANDHAL